MLTRLFFRRNHNGLKLHVITAHLQDTLGGREGVFEVGLTPDAPGTGVEIKR
jgi:hypothetical protein